MLPPRAKEQDCFEMSWPLLPHAWSRAILRARKLSLNNAAYNSQLETARRLSRHDDSARLRSISGGMGRGKCGPPPIVGPYQCEGTIGLPSLKVTLLMLNAPPGAPLRNGSIFKISSSPGFKVLAVHPSRASALGVLPSRFHTWVVPSASLTSRTMKTCGAVYLQSFTTPARSIGFA